MCPIECFLMYRDTEFGNHLSLAPRDSKEENRLQFKIKPLTLCLVRYFYSKITLEEFSKYGDCLDGCL